MRTRRFRSRSNNRRFLRRGGVVVQVAVMSTVILGCGALAIDLGMLYKTRTELQRAADAAALAGASGYITDDGLLENTGPLTEIATQRALAYSFANPTLGEGTLLDASDVVLGTFNFDQPDAPLDTSGVQRFNAVELLVRRTPGSLNGPVSYLFAGIFGRQEGGLVASAVAAVDDRFGGFEVTEENGVMLPVTIHEDIYTEMLASGPDEWAYEDGEVINFGDFVSEIRLFPWRNNGQGGGGGGEEEGAGNFGLLNVGWDNVGLPPVEQQILNGITPGEMEAEIGTPQVVFYDEYGNPVTHEITGTPGLKAGMEGALNSRVADVIAFFIHDDLWDDGTNTVYRIVDIRFARVMHVNLHGNPHDKQLVVQPLAYTGPGVIVRSYADPSQGQVGMVRLVR